MELVVTPAPLTVASLDAEEPDDADELLPEGANKKLARLETAGTESG